jgi:hypothetical protein
VTGQPIPTNSQQTDLWFSDLQNMVRANSNKFLSHHHVVQLFQEYGYFKTEAQIIIPFWLHNSNMIEAHPYYTEHTPNV